MEENTLPGNWEHIHAPVPYDDTLDGDLEHYTPSDPEIDFVARNESLSVLIECRLLSLSSTNTKSVAALVDDGAVAKAIPNETITTESPVPMIDVLALTEANTIDTRLTESIGGQLFPPTLAEAQRKVQAVLALSTHYNRLDSLSTTTSLSVPDNHPVLLAISDLRNPSSVLP